MRPLVAVRRAAAFDPDFVARHSLFWPLARAAAAFARYDDFPPVEAFANVFEGDAPVRFVRAAPRRRRRAALDVQALYDARITRDHEVPTRARCWHDLMNGLVWGTFPRAKSALHARQHRAIAERVTPGDSRLPAARTAELDALALLDEGGVLSLGPSGAPEPSKTVVFGHALYESLALGITPAVVAAIPLKVDDGEPDRIRAVDCALAEVIEDRSRLRTPREFERLPIRIASTSWGAFPSTP